MQESAEFDPEKRCCPVTTAVITRSRFALIDALNAEWRRLAVDDQLSGYARAEITRWAAEYPALSGCRSPADVLAAIHADPDPVLLTLIGIHQSGLRSVPPRTRIRTAAEFAGRVVLQTMLAKVVTMAGRDRRHAVEDYVGTLWARVGSYPVDRRPRRVAANLALDTLKAVTGDREPVSYPMDGAYFDRLDRRQLAAWGFGGAGTDEADGDAADDLTAHRVLRIAQDLDLIDEPTRRLLRSVYADGLSSGRAAEKYGLSPATVRYRCSRAVRRMARHAAAITAAA